MDESIKCIDSISAFKEIKYLVAEDEKFTLILQNELNKLNEAMLDDINLEETEDNIFNVINNDNINWQQFNEQTPKRPTIAINTRSKRNSSIQDTDENKLNKIVNTISFIIIFINVKDYLL